MTMSVVNNFISKTGVENQGEFIVQFFIFKNFLLERVYEIVTNASCKTFGSGTSRAHS